MLGTFSSGMAQRVSLARAFLADPKVLLLDEPTRSLDPVSARDFREFLRRDVAGLRGCTILLATHSPEEAFDLCDRVAVLDQGRVLATGPSTTLLDRFGDEIYRVWTTMPAHPAFESPELRALATKRGVQPAEGSEWAFVELDVPGGPEAAQRALTSLVLAGVPVSRFERVSLSLADLLDRIVRASGSTGEIGR
jgi:ABC-2 type transport system ATP-binding protein